jgi:S1-C subfamily serine protease
VAVRITCPLCNYTYSIADDVRGKTIACRQCHNAILIPGPVPVRPEREGFTDRGRAAPVGGPLPRTNRLDNAVEHVSRSPQRESRRSTFPLFLVLAGGGAGLLALVAVVAGILLLNQKPAYTLVAKAPVAKAPAAPADPPPKAHDPQPAADPAPNAVDPAPQPLDPAPPEPPAGKDDGPVLAGEKIYQDLLKSTVWIVAKQKRGLPVAGGGVPGFPPAVGGGAPAGSLAGSQWSGRETLPGYGPLRFAFQGGGRVTMFDKDGASNGNYVQNGQTVTLNFPGGVTYTGQVNGGVMSGTARNLRGASWTWNLSRQGGNAGTQFVPRPPGFPSLPPMPRPPGFPGMPQPPRFPDPRIPGFPGGGGATLVTSSGTGSLIDVKYRLVVTNCHVVGDADSVVLYFPERVGGKLVAKRDEYKRKPGLPGRVVLRDERVDLALVQLDRLPAGVRALPLSKASAQPAQQVHSVGNPGASSALWVYSPGKVRQAFRDTWKVFDDLDNREHTYDGMKVETDSPINPGDSGGPLVNDRGRMVGVAHASNLDAQNMSIFIDVSEVRSLIRRYYQTHGERWGG